MAEGTSFLGERESAEATIRIAAAADLHCSEATREATTAAFSAVDGEVDLVMLAGDLTAVGSPDEAAVLADACQPLRTPVIAVLGNHDLHSGRPDEVREVLEAAGVTLLERASSVQEVDGHEIGVVGAKGFVGGFREDHLPDFGEPSLRAVYAETGREVEALAEGLRAVAVCQFRIVLLHYSPTWETLEGERRGIWAFLGTDRLQAPIVEHRPDLVLHGHAHAGRFRAEIAGVPVFNVSVPVMGRDFWVFELSGPAVPSTPIR